MTNLSVPGLNWHSVYFQTREGPVNLEHSIVFVHGTLKASGCHDVGVLHANYTPYPRLRLNADDISYWTVRSWLRNVHLITFAKARARVIELRAIDLRGESRLVER